MIITKEILEENIPKNNQKEKVVELEEKNKVLEETETPIKKLILEDIEMIINQETTEETINNKEKDTVENQEDPLTIIIMIIKHPEKIIRENTLKLKKKVVIEEEEILEMEIQLEAREILLKDKEEVVREEIIERDRGKNINQLRNWL